MTEKEFENLKVGDKVWIIPWFKGEHIFEGTIYDIKKINSKWVSVEESKGYTYPPEYVFKTKVEAFDELVRKRENSVIADRCMLQADERELAEAQAELAKAKEEEESCWITDSGEVRKVRKSDYPCYIHYATEQEAYEALADFYKGKYEEALVKSGKARFVIRCQDRICLATNIEKHTDERYWCRGYDGFEFSVYKSDTFNTRQEAEEELERRKRND